MVVLRQRHDVALRGDLEAAAAAHLHVGTLELADERAVALEHGHVKAVAVRVPDQNVARVADVDAVREVGDVLTTDATQELPLLAEHDHTVTLNTKHEVLKPLLVTYFQESTAPTLSMECSIWDWPLSGDI